MLDRFGTVVAGNKLNWRALLIAEQTTDLSATLDTFARIVPLADYERARIEREVHRHRRFIPVMVREFLTWDEMAAIEVNAPDLPGIMVDVGTTRMYPFGEQLAHVVGYVAPPTEADVADDPELALPGIRVGRAGLEKQHDLDLRGTRRRGAARGERARPGDPRTGPPGGHAGRGTRPRPSMPGCSRRCCAGSATRAPAPWCWTAATARCWRWRTNPSFDPSLFNSGVSQAQWAEWTQDKRTPLINRATAGVYAPGSTFKMAVAMAALEARAITPGDRVNCPGYLDLGDARFHCWRKDGHGSLDLRGGLKNSCDVFFYEMARRTGIDRIAAMAHRFGLGTELEIDLPGARSGLIPTREWRIGQGHPWNLGDTVVSGIGQGYIQVTPLQLATYAARVATGRKVEPHLTRKLGGVLQPGSQPADWPSLGLSERSLHVVREGMWAVVNEPGGTAPLAKLPDPRWQMAGKTGSSQVRRVSREQREEGNFDSSKLPWEFRPHALFVAYAPYDAPRYAVSVVVEHGNAGAAAAGPIARDIMIDVLQRDPAGRDELPGAQVAEREAPR